MERTKTSGAFQERNERETNSKPTKENRNNSRLFHGRESEIEGSRVSAREQANNKDKGEKKTRVSKT